jgi:DNA-3-methyladenine glycosylase I
MRAYHDSEWGVPVHDDRTFFEFLILEGAQAGLSWATVLNKRDRYRECFAGFDPQAVACFSERKISDLLSDPGLIRNRLKIAGAVSNARAFVRVQEDFGSFDAYVWRFVDGTPVVNAWTSQDQVPSSTKLSDRVAADLKRRGFRFVGTTICYSFLQATGIVDDHLTTCFRKLQPVKGMSQS